VTAAPRALYVVLATIGNFDEKPFAFCAIFTATVRATGS
jgi:hypothetical protein